jgi:hypothetical protein
MIGIKKLRWSATHTHASLNPSLPTKNTRHILIGKYSPEKPAEKRVIADLLTRNASFEHSSNKL